MALSKVIKHAGTGRQSRHIARACVFDYKSLAYEEIRAAIVKNVPQLSNI